MIYDRFAEYICGAGRKSFLNFVFFMGIMFFISGGIWALIEAYSISNGVVTVGVVRREIISKDGAFYYRISFRDQGGNEHTFTTKFPRQYPEFRVGERITVVYPPGNPGKAREVTFYSTFLVPFLLILIGLGSPLQARWLLRSYRRKYGFGT